MTPLRAGQRWRTREGEEAIIRFIGVSGSHPVKVALPRFDDSFDTTLDGKAHKERDDLVDLIKDTP